MTGEQFFRALFLAGLLWVIVWILTGFDAAGWLGVALMAPAFILCIAQAMRYIERAYPVNHTFTRNRTTAGGISSTCSCGFHYESAGRDASSRQAVMAWELQHKAAVAA